MVADKNVWKLSNILRQKAILNNLLSIFDCLGTKWIVYLTHTPILDTTTVCQHIVIKKNIKKYQIL